MSRKKMLQKFLIIFIATLILAGSIWGIKLYLREQDPKWQVAREIYRVETALQTVDEDWKLEAFSKVHPYEITRPDGPSIFYYCCVTSYIDEEPKEVTELNKAALSLVVDVDALENHQDCIVDCFDAVMGESGGNTYLCWTISPKYSCVIEFVEGTVDIEDIFCMAESVKQVQ